MDDERKIEKNKRGDKKKTTGTTCNRKKVHRRRELMRFNVQGK